MEANEKALERFKVNGEQVIVINFKRSEVMLDRLERLIFFCFVLSKNIPLVRKE